MDSQTNREAIVLLSGETSYFKEIKQAAQIHRYIRQKNVQHMPQSKRDIIRKKQSHARTLEESTKALIEKAIQNGTFYVYGETVELKSGDAKSKLDAALTQLIESVYSKLGLVNEFSESDADVLRMLNSENEQAIIPVQCIQAESNRRRRVDRA